METRCFWFCRCPRVPRRSRHDQPEEPPLRTSPATCPARYRKLATGEGWGTTERYSLGARQPNGAPVAVKEDTAAVTKLLLVCLVAKSGKVIVGLLLGEKRAQQLEEQVAAMRAQQQALAAKAPTEERAKTDELEQALERSRQREQELIRQVQEAATAAATALEKTEASHSKTPAAADQLLQCLGDAHGFCQIAPARFVWTVKQQQDHASHFGAVEPPPRRCPGCRKRWHNRKQWHNLSAQRAARARA